MKLTATILTTQFTCPFLRYVLYEAKQPLPVLGTRRRFGTVVHAARAAYELSGRSLDRAFQVLADRKEGLTVEDLREAHEILAWTHSRERGGDRLLLVEGPLSATVAGHHLKVKMDRLDSTPQGLLLAEYKAGRHVDVALVRAQLMILSFAVETVFGKAPAIWELELFRTRTVVRLEPIVSVADLARFTSHLARAIACGDREPRPFNEAFCRRCPARAYCPRATPNPLPLRAAREKPEPQLMLF